MTLYQPHSLTKIASLEDLEGWLRIQRSAGLRVVSTNGCFDVLHPGHIAYLEEAKTLGDLLVVGINSDESVKALKGSSRPIHHESDRARQVAGLHSVDRVCVFRETNPIRWLERIRPDVHVKGGDYRPEDLPEKEVVEKHGGRVVCVGMVPGFSTTSILESLNPRQS